MTAQAPCKGCGGIDGSGGRWKVEAKAQGEGLGPDFLRLEPSYVWTWICWTSAKRRVDTEPAPFERLSTICLTNPWRNNVLNDACGAAQSCEIKNKGMTMSRSKHDG